MDELKTEPRNLRNAALGALGQHVPVPRYDRSRLTPGIVHIGLGNFHRAHQAWYLHQLMQQGRALDWAIIGAGVRQNDAVMREKLLAQDCLTTLIALEPEEVSAEVIGPMIDYVPVEPGHGALIAAMADPAIRIVSLTITEGGYYLSPEGGFDAEHPDILADLVKPSQPVTAFGAMLEALRLRRDRGLGPFAAQSCDNLQGNGDVLRQTLLGLAQLRDPVLAGWIVENMSFPNAMVDCIVPATGDAERALAKRFGLNDPVPVTHETFRQWVIEDDFCAGRPPWEEVGVTFTDDVHGFEAQKIRILNAGHQVLANAGELLGCETIADCLADPDIAAFFRKVQETEIVPLVRPVGDLKALDYFRLIEARFANPRIRDSVRRVAFDGSSRHPGFLLPTLKGARAGGRDVTGLALVEALWARMCAGTREDGSEIAPNDPLWSDLQPMAQTARENPAIWSGHRRIYGRLVDDPVFAESFANWLVRLWRDGVRQVLRDYVEAP